MFKNFLALASSNTKLQYNLYKINIHKLCRKDCVYEEI
jgi:hypothetical protein